jgi:hypothetical protein
MSEKEPGKERVVDGGSPGAFKIAKGPFPLFVRSGPHSADEL